MTTTTPLIAPLPSRFTAEQVRPGLAENLARLAYFRLMEHPQSDELDAVAMYLLGDVGDAMSKRDLWERVQPQCEHLWHLITDDWDDRDLDELTEAQAVRLPLTATEDDQQALRHEATVSRLVFEIERDIHLARVGEARCNRVRAGIAGGAE